MKKTGKNRENMDYEYGMEKLKNFESESQPGENITKSKFFEKIPEQTTARLKTKNVLKKQGNLQAIAN